MKRFTPVAAIAVLAIALLPAAALAQHHGRRHHHHQRSHHHARSHTKRFGERNSPNGGSSQQNPTTPPATAGTIQSFDGTTLTIKLANGSLVSGQVTNRTEIECRMAGDDNGNGDENMRNDDGGPSSGGSGGPGPDGNGGSGDDGNGGSGDHGDDNNMCSATALTNGASIQDAVLSISSAGAVWTRVDLSAS